MKAIIEKEFDPKYIAFGDKKDYIQILEWIEDEKKIDTMSKQWDMLYTMTLHQSSLSVGAFPAVVSIYNHYKYSKARTPLPSGVIAYTVEVEAARHLQNIKIPHYIVDSYKFSMNFLFDSFISLDSAGITDDTLKRSIIDIRNGKYGNAVENLETLE